MPRSGRCASFPTTCRLISPRDPTCTVHGRGLPDQPFPMLRVAPHTDRQGPAVLHSAPVGRWGRGAKGASDEPPSFTNASEEFPKDADVSSDPSTGSARFHRNVLEHLAGGVRAGHNLGFISER